MKRYRVLNVWENEEYVGQFREEKNTIGFRYAENAKPIRSCFFEGIAVSSAYPEVVHTMTVQCDTKSLQFADVMTSE